MSNAQGRVKLALKGMAMGIAEVIPGVSGGTIALITGIYEDLIETIKSVDIRLLRLLGQFKFKEAGAHINILFLICLLAGMLFGIVIGVFGISHLMEAYPEELWGFFFGLILASAIYVARSIHTWKPSYIGAVLLGAVAAFLITRLTPAEGSVDLLYVFMCGAIAICALILPGISGSFVLLLLGMYTTIIPTVRHFLSTFDTSDLLILGVFGVGCAVGLIVFSRVLSWMFKKYHQLTLALLTGIMLGSLNKIWPWRNPVQWMNDAGEVTEIPVEGQELRVLREINVLPADYALDTPNTLIVLLCAVLGFALVFVLERSFASTGKSSLKPS